ncbi:MAG: hypothetical protein JW833_12305, partial [Prolixibacteraceae bacterium]|nr:hypothetical protein [Prolixibacteraceae bacterium]
MKRGTLFIIIFAVAVLFQFCKSSQKEITPDAVYGKYISAYTSGIISVESPVLIKLAKPVEDEIIPGNETQVSLFNFNPALKGKAVWIDKETIEFVPDVQMHEGTTYIVKFKLGEIIKTEDGFEEFPFSFTTIKQSFSVNQEGLKTYPGNDFSYMFYTGYVLTADVTEAEDVEKLLKSNLNGKNVGIRWTHESDRRKHFFTIDSLKRDESKPQNLLIEWDGKSINVDEKGKQELIVPSLNDFKVLDATVARDPQLSVVVSFSDPLDKLQNFDGLVTLDEADNLKFSVDRNQLKIYPGSPLTGQRKLTISQGIENALNYPLKNDQDYYLVFDNIKPQVRLIGKGVIVPQDGQLSMPIEAVSLNAVDLRIIQVYADNVFQFLQGNNPDEYDDLKKVARLVYSGKVELKAEFPEQFLKWNTYKVNIADYVQLEQGAFYRIEIRFKRAYSLYNCGEVTDNEADISRIEEQLALNEEQESWDRPGWYENYYYPQNYDWQERDNPCSDSYYNSSNFVARNIFASSLGIIVKEGKGHNLTFAITNLNTTIPEQGVKLSIYDYQKRLMQTIVSDNNGLATVDLDKKPFLLIAEKGNQTGYLRLDDGSSLSLSNFDVSGQVVQEGLKGFIYGERGVWRPGDKMFLTFIMEDKLKSLPENHPVIFKLINPLGQVVERRVATSGTNGFYHFEFETNNDSPTGNWEASIQVGGSYFSKQIKVETVKPNRLKIDLKLPEVINAENNQPLILNSAWLHGAPARSLKAKIDLKLVRKNTTFKGFEKYAFNDPAKDFYPLEQEFFSGQLNEQGVVSVPVDFQEIRSAPGMLKAYFTTRVFEQGGDFSINVQSTDVSPYQKYLGIKMPDSEDNWYKTDTDYEPEIVVVDMNGNSSSAGNIEVELYKIDWRWWWESGEDYLAHYVNGSYQRPVMSWNLNGIQNKTKITLNVKYRNWESNGRYLLRVKNTETGQAAGLTFYMSKWGSWRSDGMADGATMLTIRADKEKYRVGEKMKVTIPSSKSGRALVSIEGGDAIKDIFWVETSENATSFDVEITPEMAPNIFVFVSLIQPYGQTENDAPLRLYGVIPVMVENPETILNPQISIPDEIEPEQEYKVEVSEENGKEMTYTLAIVDEGLLGLTNFKTPDPHTSFYAREALGVLTWDMFDYVAGAYGARLEKAFAVGGDESLNDEAKKKVNRFKPVVEFAGPFTLKKGEKKSHTFKMPNYVGAVRAMVVAGNNGAYGNNEKEVKVRKALMLLATLPRVLGPGETFTLPVDVFAMKENVDEVKVSIECSEIFENETLEKEIVF